MVDHRTDPRCLDRAIASPERVLSISIESLDEEIAATRSGFAAICPGVELGGREAASLTHLRLVGQLLGAAIPASNETLAGTWREIAVLAQVLRDRYGLSESVAAGNVDSVLNSLSDPPLPGFRRSGCCGLARVADGVPVCGDCGLT